MLSTNWTDIGKKEVEVKPPDGMEFKKWDGEEDLLLFSHITQ